jgi:phage terminase large subunit-like protein
LPWQLNEVIVPLFGTLNKDGNRRYRTAYVEIPKKQGKSTLAAGIALYLLCADGEHGGEVYGAAMDKDQASIVFNTAADMVRRTSWLARVLQIQDTHKRIVYPKTGSFYRAIPADAAGSEGFNASGIIFDEIHTQKTRELWDTLHTGTAARRQPLTFGITTAGLEGESLCRELHDSSKEIIKGIAHDPTLFSLIYGAPMEADWTDPKLWKKVNPSLGKTVALDYLHAECEKAKQVPAYQNTFRRYHLNQWVKQETRWIDLRHWDACRGDVDPEALAGRSCYGGLDLASTTDIAALVLVFPPEAEEEPYHVLAYFWIPEENMIERSRRDRVPYDAWVRDGFVAATPGNVIDYTFIKHRIEELGGKYRIEEIAFDRWGATAISTDLTDAGFTMVQFGQGFASMSGPSKELLKLVLSKQILHGRNPVLRWMADKVVVRQDPAGNIKPDRQKSREKIDGIVAAIMALDRALRHAGPSVYEERGLLTV